MGAISLPRAIFIFQFHTRKNVRMTSLTDRCSIYLLWLSVVLMMCVPCNKSCDVSANDYLLLFLLFIWLWWIDQRQKHIFRITSSSLCRLCMYSFVCYSHFKTFVPATSVKVHMIKSCCCKHENTPFPFCAIICFNGLFFDFVVLFNRDFTVALELWHLCSRTTCTETKTPQRSV